ncbi:MULTISPECIES: RagB/SusD family nutrient uptake outer membrane protein [Chitinophagaceae]
MKRIYLAVATIISMVAGVSCSKSFLDTKPQGVIIESSLQSQQFVENALIGAYGLMNGNISGTWGNYSSAPSQWLFAEVGGDNAHKGSDYTDQGFMNDIEGHQVTSVNDQIPTMWTNYFEGVLRCNSTLSLLDALQNSSSTQKFASARATQIQAEARMLRAHYYFYLRRVFGPKIPYVDETMTTVQAGKVANDSDIYPKIVADLQFAMANLPQDYSKPLGDVGRSDKYAAEAYLGKVYLYGTNEGIDSKYAEALALFKDVITKKGDLTAMKFQNNFDVETKNGPEGIFVVQNIINPDGSGDNANVGDMLSGFYGSAPASCCGFYLASIDLVNAFKVDANGLPLLDGSYRNNPYVSDLANPSSSYKLDTTIAFDPRLDYTVGRRGVNYRDWGVMPGNGWIRNAATASPFVNYKSMIDEADFGNYTVPGTPYITAQNINIIRLADVYLMAAECAVETNDLSDALTWVNAVRNRAATLPAVLTAYGHPAAAYKVKPYLSFPSQDYARNAVRFERRLELAMEGQRFFDLVRWGIAKTTLESYHNFEKNYTAAASGSGISSYSFDPAKDSYMPIPQQEIDRGGGVLKPNGYGH